MWLSLSSSTPNVLLLCIGLIVSALYIACAALNGLGKEDGLQRAVGILFLGWSVLDASYAFYLLRILLSNYSFIASSYAAIGAEDLASITAAVYEAFLQVSIVSLLYFLAEVFTGIFAIRSCRAPKTAGVCIGLSVVVTALNTARLFLSHHDSLYLLAWGLFSVSLALSVLCVVSSVLLIRANRKSPQ